MPLLHDAEFQSELDKIAKRAKLDSTSIHKWTVWVSALILAFTIAVLEAFNVSDVLAICIIIAVASVCVMSVVIRAALLVYAGLELHIAVTEWVGRRQFGEHAHP